MKIGLVCPYNIANGGGVQEAVKEIQTELNKRGHEAVIITPQPRKPYTETDRRVIFLGTGTDFKAIATTTHISASVLTDEIDSMLEYEKFDVLHFHEPWVPVLSRQILSRSGCANVGTFHAKLPDNITSRALSKVIIPYTKPLLRHLDGFTAVSEPALKYISTLTEQPIELISNGINLPKFRRPAGLVADTNAAPNILYIGRLEKRKGVEYLVKAFALFQQQHPQARLDIAGDGVDREKLEEQVADLGLKHVTFHGFIPESEKKRLLHTATLACYPALYGESFGIVLVEAMASGAITVAGNNPGYASVLTGLGQLSLVDPYDSKEFAHRLELLMFDEGLRDLWRKWAKKEVKQYDYRKVVTKYEAVYQQALESSQKRLQGDEKHAYRFST
ncbi:MAG: glycosyltransferase family 4 protein [Candidatus Saccharimonadales bacterium]